MNGHANAIGADIGAGAETMRAPIGRGRAALRDGQNCLELLGQSFRSQELPLLHLFILFVLTAEVATRGSPSINL